MPRGFIVVHVEDNEVRVNLATLAGYYRNRVGAMVMADALQLTVSESPEQIDALIDEAQR